MTDLAIGEQYVYYSDNSGIHRAFEDGMDTGSLIVSLASAPDDIAVDDTALYWLYGNELAAANLDGTMPAVLASGVVADRFFLSDTNVYYWTNSGWTLYVVPKSGGTPEALGPTGYSLVDIAVDATHIYFTARGPTYLEILARMPLAGGAVEVLFEGDLTSIGAVALDTSYVYWSAYQQGSGGYALALPK